MSGLPVPTGLAGFATFLVDEGGGLPVSVYYPAAEEATARRHSAARIFTAGYSTTFLAYLHVFGGELHACMRAGALGWWLVRMTLSPLLFLIDLVVYHLRLAYTVPHTLDAPPPRPGRHPVILFSHGLTGMGPEHAFLFSEWARRGFVVVAPTHVDGSAACAHRPGGQKYYEHPERGWRLPAGTPEFRPAQVEGRADQLQSVVRHLLSRAQPRGDAGAGDAAEPLSAVYACIDMDRLMLSGFSYGAATVTLVAARAAADGCAAGASAAGASPSVGPRPRAPPRGLILLDGWFSLEVGRLGGAKEHLPFPRRAHEEGLAPPTLFVGSQASQPGLQPRTNPGSNHAAAGGASRGAPPGKPRSRQPRPTGKHPPTAGLRRARDACAPHRRAHRRLPQPDG